MYLVTAKLLWASWNDRFAWHFCAYIDEYGIRTPDYYIMSLTCRTAKKKKEKKKKKKFRWKS